MKQSSLIVGYQWWRWIVGLSLLGSLSMAGAVTPKTVLIDGNCAEWTADEKFPGNDSTELWVTWDADRLYLGWWGGGPSTHRRIAALDLTPNVADTTATMTYSGVQFPPRGIADYVIEFQNLQVWFTYRTGSSYTTVINPPGTANFFAPLGCAGVNFAEVSIPRDLFTTGSVAGLVTTQTLAVSGWYFDAGSNFVYGGAPTINSSGFANRSFTHAVRFATTDGGRSPNTYGTTVDQVPVALSRWGVE